MSSIILNPSYVITLPFIDSLCLTAVKEVFQLTTVKEVSSMTAHAGQNSKEPWGLFHLLQSTLPTPST